MKEVVEILRGKHEGRVKREMARLESIRYNDDLMAMDDQSEEELEDGFFVSERGARDQKKEDETSSFYGVFGASPVQDPHAKTWGRFM